MMVVERFAVSLAPPLLLGRGNGRCMVVAQRGGWLVKVSPQGDPRIKFSVASLEATCSLLLAEAGRKKWLLHPWLRVRREEGVAIDILSLLVFPPSSSRACVVP